MKINTKKSIINFIFKQRFYQVEILYDNISHEYQLTKDHSNNELTCNYFKHNENEILNKLDSFKEEIISIWNKQKTYSRRTFLSLAFKEYKSKDRNFPYNPVIFSNLLNNWKNIQVILIQILF